MHKPFYNDIFLFYRKLKMVKIESLDVSEVAAENNSDVVVSPNEVQHVKTEVDILKEQLEVMKKELQQAKTCQQNAEKCLMAAETTQKQIEKELGKNQSSRKNNGFQINCDCPKFKFDKEDILKLVCILVVLRLTRK